MTASNCECESGQQLIQRPAALPLLPCAHARLSIGLDRACCPDCRGEFLPRTPEYKSAMLLPTPVAAPEQLLIVTERSSGEETTGEQFCSGANRETSQSANFTGAPKSAPEQKHWVEMYSPSNRKDHKYYRYMWMEGRKLKHRHIPGGNAKSPAAIARAGEIKSAIAMGKSPLEIEQLIKSWKAINDPQ